MKLLIFSYYYSTILWLFQILLRLGFLINNKKIIVNFIDLNNSLNKFILYSTIIYYNVDIRKKSFFEIISNTTPNNQISNILTFVNYDYAINTLISIYDKDLEFITHHLITMSCIYSCQIYNHHQVAILFLFLFNTSSPFLSTAKLLHYYNQKELADIFFYLFAIVFFNFRIILFTCLLIYGIFYCNYYNYNYYLINTTGLIIYKFQIDWLFKIIEIIAKK